MDSYMPSYAKQEGYVINAFKEHGGTVIRWRGIHAGRYNNFQRLPVEVTNKNQCQEAVGTGTLISLS